jgi:hypothetical protein
MKPNPLATALACLLGLAGCLSTQQPLADSPLDGGDGSEQGLPRRDSGTAAPVRGVHADSGVIENPVQSASAHADASSSNPQKGDDPQPANAESSAQAAGHDAGIAATVKGEAGPDASTSNMRYTAHSHGCEPVVNFELCVGEGWMLAPGESIPECGRSGAYRVCTFENGACVSHTVMMVQRCE